MILLLAAHVVLAGSAPVLVARWGRCGFVVAALAPALALGWLLAAAPTVLAGHDRVAAWSWAPALGLDVPLRLDALGLVMGLLVTGVGCLTLVYSARYFPPRREGLGQVCAVLTLFSGAMLALVLADNMLALYIAWELTTVCSFLLIGDGGRDREHRRAAIRALLVTAAGGFTLLLGLLLLGAEAGTFRISALLAQAPSGPRVDAAVVLVLLGAVTKAAQVPFHSWLPAAMVAPTPVSAYLHAAAMVKAGIYLVARFAPALADTPPWRPIVFGAGVVSMVFCGWRALVQTDLKRLLAYGTIAQLGFLVLLAGAGTRTAAVAAATMLLAHALFKAALFMLVGVIDHVAGTRDLTRLSGLARRAPWLLAVAVLACASMAGLPPFVGYLGKEAALEAFFEPGPGHRFVLIGVTAGSILTVAYTLHFLWGAFGGRRGADLAWQAPGTAFVAPGALLAVTGLAAGLVPAAVDALAVGAAAPYAAGAAPYHVALWHGVGPPLALSVVTVVAGAVTLVGVRRLDRLGPFGRVVRSPGPDLLGRAAHAGLRLARVVTARTQVGSLPVYLTVVFAAVLVLAGGTLLAGGMPPAIDGRPRWWDHPVQGVLVAGVAMCCVGALRATTRPAAVLLVSAVGYLVAGLFVVHGAPDVALAQVLVEPLTLLIVVLVLRRLPAAEPSHPRGVRALQLAVATGFGIFVGLATLATAAGHVPSRVADPYIEQAPERGGTNVVNVVVTDFRATDTLGEISVLAIAATGVASLVLVSTRRGRAPRVDPDRSGQDATGGGADAHGDLAGPATTAPATTAPAATAPPGEPPAPDREPSVARSLLLAAVQERPAERRILLLEVVTRVLYPSILVAAVYLLLVGLHRPGGGFAAGLLVGLGLVLRFLGGGPKEFGHAAPVPPGALLGGGLALAAGYGIAGLLLSGGVLAAASHGVELGPLGRLEFSTSMVFELGVALIVAGLVADVLRTLGVAAEEDT